jgi:hypothetical protein
MSLWPGRTYILALVGLFLSEVIILERSFAAVAVVEPVVISLSPILNWYRLNSLNRLCVTPGQQAVLAHRRRVHPCLAQSATLSAFHVEMSKLQAQHALYRLLEGFLLRGRRNSAKLGQAES